MQPTLFSNQTVLQYIKFEYNEYVKDIMKNLESAIGSSDDKIEVARKFAKEKMMLVALKNKDFYREDLV